MNMQRIIVGVDGSEGGRRALEWALREGSATGADVIAVTVFPYDGRADILSHRAPQTSGLRATAARRQHAEIEAVLAAVADPPVVVPTVVPGLAAQALTAMTADADLLVVGSHDHGPRASRTPGTVTSDCIRWSVCPVVVIPAARVGAGV